MENKFISYSSADEFIIQDKESDRFLDKYEIVAYLNEQNQQIADLETKLKESEKENKLIIQEYGECLLCGDGYCINNDVAKIVQENKKLKQDKEHLNYHLIDKNCECELLKLEQNKTAIYELEKIINFFEPYENSEKDTILCVNNGISFLEYIDQQISNLKGEK